MVQAADWQHNAPISERNGNNRRRPYDKSRRNSVKEIARSTDPVRRSVLTALLSDGGVTAILFDTHASIVQGSLGVIPQRLMVADDEYETAVTILKSAKEWHEPEQSG
jgi:hypothetical protein